MKYHILLFLLLLSFFIIYASLLVYNVAYALPLLLNLGAWAQSAEIPLFLLGTVLSFVLCLRFFQRFHRTITTAGNTKLLAITDIIMLSYLSAIASQKGFAKVFDLHHLVSRILIILPAMLFILVVLMLLEEISKNEKLNTGLRNLEELYNKEKSYHQQLLQHKEQERALQQRVQRNIAKLEQLLEKQDFAALEQHFDQLLASSDKLQRVVLSGNRVVDAVVGYWRERAYADGMDWQSEINIAEIAVDDMDLAIILGNALENAHTAAKGTSNPSISLKITTKNGLLLIALSNNFQGEVRIKDGKYYSAKRGFRQPGTGLANIRLVVEKYQGYFKINSDNQLFRLQLALNNRRQD